MASVERHLRRRIRLAVAGAVVLTALTAATASASMPSAEGAGAQTPGGLAARPDRGGPARSPFPGFLLDRGRYTTFDVPGTRAGATPSGVNDRGQIVGKFNDGTASSGAGASEHGFVLDRRGRFTRIDLPGARSTASTRINDRGQVAGVYSQTTGRVGDDPNRRGFLLDHGRLTRIDRPGAVYTQAFGLNDHGQVVGEFQDAAGFHAFLWDKGRFTTIDPPGAALTFVTDVNDRGQIVGSGFSGTNPTTAVSHGFVLRDGVKGAFTPIDVPGALGTGAGGINDRGQVTGGYTPPAAGSTRQPTGTQPSMGLGL